MKKNITTETSTAEEISRFIKIMLGLTFVIVAIFLFTKYVVNDGDVKLPIKSPKEAEIIHNNVVVGTMFNRSDAEYYVFAFDQTELLAAQYLSLVQNFMTNPKNPTIYLLDLHNNLNKPYIGDENNTSAKDITDIKLHKMALIKIKNSKITSYITDINKIKETLS